MCQGYQNNNNGLIHINRSGAHRSKSKLILCSPLLRPCLGLATHLKDY